MYGTWADGVALVDEPCVVVVAVEGYFVFLVVGDGDLVDGGGVFEGEFGVGEGDAAVVVGGGGGALEKECEGEQNDENDG